MSLQSESRHARRGWRRYWTLIIFTSVAVYFTSDAQPTSLSNRLPKNVVAPISITSSYLGKRCKEYYKLYFDNARSASELASAKESIEELKSQRLEVEQLKQEVKELRTQLEFSEARKDLDLLPATILAKKPSEFSKRLTIKFSNDVAHQVRVGAPVVSADALLGQIIEIDGEHAEVMLLSDPRSAVDIRLSMSGGRGIATGVGQEGSYRLRLKYLNQEQAIENDEILLTSGKDGKFPMGLPVGKIRTFTDEETAHGQPFEVIAPTNLDDIHYVFIVRGHSGISADGSKYEEK